MTFFAIEIEHADKKVSKCLINLDHVVQIVFDERVGKVKTIDNHVYNMGKPEIDRLLKIMKHEKLITTSDLSIAYYQNETNNRA